MNKTQENDQNDYSVCVRVILKSLELKCLKIVNFIYKQNGKLESCSRGFFKNIK